MTENESIRRSKEGLDNFRKRYSDAEIWQMLIAKGTINEQGEVLLPEDPTMDNGAASETDSANAPPSG